MDTTRFDRLQFKLFAAIAGTIAALTFAAYAVFSWSFDRGFVDFINRADEARLETLIDTLAQGYAREGGWGWIAKDRERWVELVRSNLGLPAATPTEISGQPQSAGAARLPLTIDPRLLLFDAARQRLIGRAELAERAVLRPIVSGGRTVGYLGYVPRTELIESIERVYLSRQHVTFAGLAAAMVVASLLLAAGVSYWLTRRVRDLANAAQAMTAGHYDQRLQERGHDELAQLARDFNTLAEALETARRARQQWIADIAHELRTPLSVLRGEIEALQDGVRSLDQTAVGSLAAEAARLARLVEDLHTLSMSDLGALTYFKEPVDVAEIVADVIDPQRRALDQQGLALRLELQPGVIIGDGERLAQLFANLLQNSIRYTDYIGAGARRGASPNAILFCREKKPEREIWDGFRYGPEAAREVFGFDEAYPFAELDASCPSCIANQERCTRRRGGSGVGRARRGWLNAVRAKVRTGVTAPAEIRDVRA